MTGSGWSCFVSVRFFGQNQKKFVLLKPQSPKAEDLQLGLALLLPEAEQDADLSQEQGHAQAAARCWQDEAADEPQAGNSFRAAEN